MSERVEVHIPDPSKSGTMIDRAKYDVVRKAIWIRSRPMGRSDSGTCEARLRKGFLMISMAPPVGTLTLSTWTWRSEGSLSASRSPAHSSFE